MEKYRKGDKGNLERGSRVVVPWANGVAFRCPCDERDVLIASPTHTIAFDEDGILTLSPSCGFKATASRPQNWCHFFIKNGVPEICGDSKCPGGGANV